MSLRPSESPGCFAHVRSVPVTPCRRCPERTTTQTMLHTGRSFDRSNETRAGQARDLGARTDVAPSHRLAVAVGHHSRRMLTVAQGPAGVRRRLRGLHPGPVVFGIFPGPVVTITTPTVYNDGSWHLATASVAAHWYAA